MYKEFKIDKKKKKDGMLALWIAVVVILFLIVGIPAVRGIHEVHRYRTFVNEYTDSLNHARKNGGVTVGTVEEDVWRMTADQGSRLYTLIIDAGMGKPQKEDPAGKYYYLTFPNGSELRLCEVEIMEKSRKQDKGLFISFENKDNTVYMYDTDNIDVDLVLAILSKKQ